MKRLCTSPRGQRLVELRAIPDDRRAFAELRQCTIPRRLMNGWPSRLDRPSRRASRAAKPHSGRPYQARRGRRPASRNTHLGGDDIDHKIIDWIVADYRKDQGIDLGKDRIALQRLKSPPRRPSASSPRPSRRRSTFPSSPRRLRPKHLVMKLSGRSSRAWSRNWSRGASDPAGRL